MTTADHWQVKRVDHPDAPGLADLVGDVAGFRRDVAFRRPLHHKAGDPARFADVDRLWDDLLTRGSRQPAFRLVRAGDTTARGGLTRRLGMGSRRLDDVIDANRVIDRYRQGDTVVIQGLQHTNPHLARLANNLALAVDHPIQINAYLSPPAEQGLDLHFDFHDVFVVQIGGAKRWRIWDPVARTVDPVRGRQTAPLTLDELGPPALELTLRAGDVLYLPRGYPHTAETADERSDHLTIGLMVVTWQRVLAKALDAEVAAGHFTASVPVLALDPGRAAPPPPDPSRLAERSDPVFRHWLAREVWRRQPATRLRPRVAPELTDARLEVPPGPLLWLTELHGRAVLGLGDRVLDLPAPALPLLAAVLAAAEPFRPADLPGLDGRSRDVVLTRLLADGVLTRAR
ncbi:MAG: cupin domain-containing protein [Acidimicrobiales bacterium]